MEARMGASEVIGLAQGAGLERAGIAAGPGAPGQPRAYLVAALGYPLGSIQPGQSVPAKLLAPPLASIGSFARAHYYAELVNRLLSLRSSIMAALPSGAYSKRDFPVLVNSRRPERPLAEAAGLGARGRNGLLIVEGLGCASILGAMGLPFGIEGAGEGGSGAMHRGCAGCRSCLETCPTEAIREEGGIMVERCLQHWASTPGEVPAAIRERWGDLLYGCDACIRACPMRGGNGSGGAPGAIGDGLSIKGLMEASDDEVKVSLKGTALGLAWLGPGILKRNAALASDSLAGEALAAKKKSD